MPRSTVKSLRALFSISSLRSGQAVSSCPEYRGTFAAPVHGPGQLLDLRSHLLHALAAFVHGPGQPLDLRSHLLPVHHPKR